MEAFRRLLPGPQADGLTAVDVASEVPGRSRARGRSCCST